MADEDPDYTHLIALIGNYMDANRKLHEQVAELQARSTREVLARRKTLRSMVRSFHAANCIEMPAIPAFPSYDVQLLRERLIEEELIELKEAMDRYDLVEVADALGDLAFVVEGAFLAYGIDSGPVLEEIYRSNMTKSGGGTRADGKIQKGPSYSPPDLRSVLLAQGREI